MGAFLWREEMTVLNRQSKLWLGLVLFGLLICYYAVIHPALYGPFLFDDFANLQHLSILNNHISANLGDYLAAFEGNPGRPLAALSFLLNDNAWPSAAFGFKYTNVMIHLLNAVLVFGLIRQLAKASTKLPQHAIWPVLAMLAWLFHPINISAQMLVVQRMTLLAGTFSLAGLWAYTALLQRSSNWRGAFVAMAALGTATLLAFLCKETGALLPLFALVLNATLLAELFSQKDRASQRLILVGCGIPALALLHLILDMGFQENAFFHREFSLADRLLTQLHVVSDYLRQILFPSLTGSGIYYDDYPITRLLFSPISTLLIGLAMIAALTFAMIFRKRYVLLSFAVLWFFAGHLMESTVLPLELYYEHRNYIPLLGLVLAVTALPFYLGERKQIAFLFLGIWLAMLAAITTLQAPVWGQQVKLVSFWIVEHPKSLRATQELAKYYYDTADPQASVDVMMIAYNNGVHSADLPLNSLLINCWKPGVKYKNIDLLSESITAIKTSPFSNGSLVILQKLNQEVQNNRCPDVLNRQSWLALSNALLANPKFKRAGSDFIHIERAKLMISAKDLSTTMREFEAAYAAQPSTEMSYKIAETLISAGFIDDAELWLKKGLALKKPWFKKWLSSDKEKSMVLIKLIEQAKKQTAINTIPVTSQKKD